MFLSAEYVLTDSFHGTAFSVNLGRKFVSISPGRFSGAYHESALHDRSNESLSDDYRNLSIVNQPYDFACAAGFARKRLVAKSFLTTAVNE